MLSAGTGTRIVRTHPPLEWPTLALLAATYAVWALASGWLAAHSLPLGIAVAALAIAQHSSLQHEATHGHPTGNRLLNTLLVSAGLTVVIPYLRFRDTHMDHHQNSRLTDPYDDPESNYLDGGTWDRLPGVLRVLLSVNNTLAGRILLGPLIGTVAFLISDIRQMRSDPRVAHGWLWHVPMVAPVLVWVWWAPMPVWAYGIACYLALSLLRIRTFLEHQAHEQVRARSVIIEDRGLLAVLFLNNNFHVVHHMHPHVPWYRLPRLYRENAERFRRVNGGYVFRSYGEVFRRYLFRRKDPVAHPIWRRG